MGKKPKNRAIRGKLYFQNRFEAKKYRNPLYKIK